MTRKTTFFLSIILGLIGNKALSKNSIVSAGESVKNSNGSLTYTVGQTSYQNYQNGYSIAEGVQQPNVNYVVLNTSELEQDNISVFPNPTIDILNINSKHKFQKYEVFDLSGKILKKSVLHNSTIDLSSFSSGNYIISLISNNKIKTVKILKK